MEKPSLIAPTANFLENQAWGDPLSDVLVCKARAVDNVNTPRDPKSVSPKATDHRFVSLGFQRFFPV